MAVQKFILCVTVAENEFLQRTACSPKKGIIKGPLLWVRT